MRMYSEQVFLGVSYMQVSVMLGSLLYGETVAELAVVAFCPSLRSIVETSPPEAGSAASSSPTA